MISALPLGSGPTGLPAISDDDVACGYLFGIGPLATLPERIDPDPVRALREALRPALLRTPCVIAFSGGRDSSLLLAVAADLAAREGLEPPTAFTFRCPGDAASEESSWQHLVTDHLRAAGLPITWLCQDVDDELDIIGPLVGPVVREHGGPLWPPMLGPTILMAGVASGGALVTGDFGDEVLGGHRASVLRAVAGRRGRGMTRADWRFASTAAAPARIRRSLTGRDVKAPPWLRPEFARLVVEKSLSAGERPLRWDYSVRSVLSHHSVVVGNATRERIVEQQAALLVQPLGDPDFVASYATYGGRWGGIGRTAGTNLLADGLLPNALVCRQGKAYFNRSHFGPRSREFAHRWTGRGVDPAIVDSTALRAAWSAEVPPASTAMLLQRAWLATTEPPS